MLTRSRVGSLRSPRKDGTEQLARAMEHVPFRALSVVRAAQQVAGWGDDLTRRDAVRGDEARDRDIEHGAYLTKQLRLVKRETADHL